MMGTAYQAQSKRWVVMVVVTETQSVVRGTRMDIEQLCDTDDIGGGHVERKKIKLN